MRANNMARNKFTLEYMVPFVTTMFPDVKTRRGIQNRCYQISALTALQNEQGIKAIFDEKKDIFKWGILEQLGRIEQEEIIIQLAHAICRHIKGNPDKNTTQLLKWVKLMRIIIQSEINSN